MTHSKDSKGKFVFLAVWFLAAVAVYLWVGGGVDARGLQVSVMGALTLLLCFYLGVRLRRPGLRLALLGTVLASAVYLYLSAFRIVDAPVDVRLVQATILAVLLIACAVSLVGSRSRGRPSIT